MPMVNRWSDIVGFLWAKMNEHDKEKAGKLKYVWRYWVGSEVAVKVFKYLEEKGEKEEGILMVS